MRKSSLNRPVKMAGNTGVNVTKYSQVHKYLINEFGKANQCEMCKVEGKSKYEWALKKGFKYDFNVDNFIQMCCSCHRKYDITNEVRVKCSIANKGKKMGKDNGRARPIIHIEYGVFYDTLTEAALIHGIKNTTLLAMLNGQNPNKTKLRYA